MILAALTTAAAEPPGSPFNREAFDRLDRSINNGNGYKSGSGSDIAWGESYIMLAYVDMYRATRDTYYLDKLVDHADHVLDQRDDIRGFKDYSGRSRPAWSVGGKYTVAELILRDAGGGNVLKFRSTRYAFNDQTILRVTTRPSDDRFDLVIENPQWPPREEHKGLTMARNSPEFIEKRLNDCRNVALERKIACADGGSKLVTVEVLGHASGLPAKDEEGKPLADCSIRMNPLVMAYHGYSGQATYPMLEFAWVVRQDPALRARYSAQADRYVAEAAKVFADADEEWRDGPGKGEGYYVLGARGCPFWTDNVPKPFNYLASEGRSLVRLAQLTSDRRWRERAEAIARLLKRHLRLNQDDSYVWDYWWGSIEKGWTRENSPSFNTPAYSGALTVEDSSHGHLEMEFVSLCVQTGWVFNETDAKRFARTFLNHMIDREKWTMNNRVDGKSSWGKHDSVIGGWMELAAWNPEVARVGRRIGEAQKLHNSASGAGLMTFARLFKSLTGYNVGHMGYGMNLSQTKGADNAESRKHP